MLSTLTRLSRGDAKSAGEGLNRVRALLAELRADPLLNNTVERLENQLKYALSAYKRAIEAGANASHLNAQTRAAGIVACRLLLGVAPHSLRFVGRSGDKSADAERESLAKKLKERVEEAEKTLEELIDL